MEMKEMTKTLVDDEERRETIECRNENCDLVIPKSWNFCPECGTTREKQEDPRLILESSIAYLALYELDPYEFKLFMYIYFESEGAGLQWKRIKQVDLEKDCTISHPKVLKSIKELKGDNSEENLIVGDDAGKLLHWIIAESRTERWTKGQGYGLHTDLHDYERIKEMLEPHQEEKRRRNRSYY